jgi:hypothetical protein
MVAGRDDGAVVGFPHKKVRQKAQTAIAAAKSPAFAGAFRRALNVVIPAHSSGMQDGLATRSVDKTLELPLLLTPLRHHSQKCPQLFFIYAIPDARTATQIPPPVVD